MVLLPAALIKSGKHAVEHSRKPAASAAKPSGGGREGAQRATKGLVQSRLLLVKKLHSTGGSRVRG